LQTLDDWTDDSSEYDCAEIRHIECKPRGLNTFGQVIGGSITLFANRIPVRYDGPLVDELKFFTKLTGAGIGECQFQIDAMEDIALAQKKEISCIEIMRERNTNQGYDSNNRSVVAIVVVPSDLVPGAYQRIGLVSYSSSARTEDLGLSEITIV
jgi:hypothetical protein